MPHNTTGFEIPLCINSIVHGPPTCSHSGFICFPVKETAGILSGEHSASTDLLITGPNPGTFQVRASALPAMTNPSKGSCPHTKGRHKFLCLVLSVALLLPDEAAKQHQGFSKEQQGKDLLCLLHPLPPSTREPSCLVRLEDPHRAQGFPLPVEHPQ